MQGKVTLIGAGPGDKGLLTLKGHDLLLQADVVVYDRLVGKEILELIPHSATKINVGKRSADHPVPQHEINRLLLEKAQQGNQVVRLKGGDPFLFGRGGEELELLAQNGIPFEVVPGITSAISVPSYAGIPVTHRDFCSSLHIVTGHAQVGEQLDIDFEALVRTKGTLVFLMGVSAVERICNGLLQAGIDPTMPAAIVQNGTYSDQRKLITTVGSLSERTITEKIASPAIIIVGKVCTLSDEFDWFSKQPLKGKTVLVTRPRASQGTLSDKLRALGAQVIGFPCISTEEIRNNQKLEQAICTINDYNWIVFTSKFGAELFFNKMMHMKIDIRHLSGIKLAVIGPETAKECTNRGMFVDYYPDVYDAEHLANGLCTQVQSNEKLLICRAQLGNPILTDILTAGKIDFEEIITYNTVYTSDNAEQVRKMLINNQIEYVTFTSASTVTGFITSIGELDYSAITGICIGKQTAQQAEKYGIKTIVSKKATIDDMIETIKEGM